MHLKKREGQDGFDPDSPDVETVWRNRKNAHTKTKIHTSHGRVKAVHPGTILEPSWYHPGTILNHPGTIQEPSRNRVRGSRKTLNRLIPIFHAPILDHETLPSKTRSFTLLLFPFSLRRNGADRACRFARMPPSTRNGSSSFMKASMRHGMMDRMPCHPLNTPEDSSNPHVTSSPTSHRRDPRSVYAGPQELRPLQPAFHHACRAHRRNDAGTNIGAAHPVGLQGGEKTPS